MQPIVPAHIIIWMPESLTSFRARKCMDIMQHVHLYGTISRLHPYIYHVLHVL